MVCFLISEVRQQWADHHSQCGAYNVLQHFLIQRINGLLQHEALWFQQDQGLCHTACIKSDYHLEHILTACDFMICRQVLAPFITWARCRTHVQKCLLLNYKYVKKLKKADSSIHHTFVTAFNPTKLRFLRNNMKKLIFYV